MVGRFDSVKPKRPEADSQRQQAGLAENLPAAQEKSPVNHWFLV